MTFYKFDLYLNQHTNKIKKIALKKYNVISFSKGFFSVGDYCFGLDLTNWMIFHNYKTNERCFSIGLLGDDKLDVAKTKNKLLKRILHYGFS